MEKELQRAKDYVLTLFKLSWKLQTSLEKNLRKTFHQQLIINAIIFSAVGLIILFSVLFLTWKVVHPQMGNLLFELSELIFLLSGSVFALFNLRRNNPFLGYGLGVFFLLVASFIGFVTFKNLFIKRQVAYEALKPDKVIHKNNGVICYIYNTGYYLTSQNKWIPSKVAICRKP